MSAEQTTKTISFGISGEFITRVAREWLYIEGKSIDKIMQLLTDSMAGTDTPEATIRRYAEDILIGRASLKGNTADGTYHLETYEPEEQPEMGWNFLKILQENTKKRKELQEKLDDITGKYLVALNYIPSYRKNSFLEEIGEEPEEDNSLLGSYMKRMLDEDEHETEDYGWLEPDGTFHAVEWGDHQEWAQEYLENNFPEVAEDDDVDMQTKCNVGLIGAGDWLVEHGWVLLHNPSQGIAFPTKHPIKDYTKKQRDFLYGYYIDRNCRKEADSFMED